ncbi:MAG TPA: sugar phosphate isomerase/epimerase [Actinopolymorphaceae bacterium]
MWTLSGFADEIDPDPDVQFRTLNELGIGYVEFRSAWGTNVLDLDDAQLAVIKGKLAEYGIAVSAVGSPIGKIGIHDDFDAHLARFDRALRVARELDTRYIRLFSFFVPADEEPADHRDEVLRRMSALLDRAKGHDVVLCHENERHIYGDVPSRCLDLVESLGSDRFRLIWDPANYVLCGVRPHTEGYEQLRPHLEYLQIKDAVMATGQIVPTGEGDGEIPLTVRALRDSGFEGFFSMEPHLAHAGAAGGFSGPEMFAKATKAFTGLLDAENIPYD